MKLARVSAYIFSAILPFIGTAAHAAPFPNVVSGAEAKALFELAVDAGEPDATGPVEASGGCHYTKNKNRFSLALCDYQNGFINSPVREMFSNILLANRTPIFLEEGRYGIAIHFVCTRFQDDYQCSIEDLADFHNRIK